MKILVAEDDAVSRSVLVRLLHGWRHEVIVTCDGRAAWSTLQAEDAPKLAILDWMMPGMDGVEICSRVRDLQRTEPTYVILLTAKGQAEDLANGLGSGANDYIRKPFSRLELHSRILVGERMIALQHDLADRVRQLEEALAKVNQLQGLLPICSYCKKVRDDRNYWQRVETYIESHVDVQFSHGICPECFENVVTPELAKAGIQVSTCPPSVTVS